MSQLAGADSLSLVEQLVEAGFERVAGADEAGRGACAGPLVAAAVILPVGAPIAGLADSKQLTARKRDLVYELIVEKALAWSVVEISPGECDALGMQAVNLAALRRVLLRLSITPDFALTDGFAVDGLGFPALGVWKGDQVAACVSAASVIAKVTRDRIMDAAAKDYPQYLFEKHKGYCTQAHRRCLEQHGPCGLHRLSYANVQRAREVWLASL
jgi:ribonuclease HII